MRYSVEHREQTRARIMQAASRVFREGGFGGAGIDGLTKAAGVTNGAFYGHFKSKADAFREAVAAGLDDVRRAVLSIREEHADHWVSAFAQFYLGPQQEVPIGEACLLPTLSSEVMRADKDTQLVYAAGLQAVLEAMAAGMPGDDAAARDDAAIATLALLVGGALLGRAVGNPSLAKQIHQSVVKRTAVELCHVDCEPTPRPQRV